MVITDRAIDQVFSDLKKTCGGVRNDYFGLLYYPRAAEQDVMRLWTNGSIVNEWVS